MSRVWGNQLKPNTVNSWGGVNDLNTFDSLSEVDKRLYRVWNNHGYHIHTPGYYCYGVPFEPEFYKFSSFRDYARYLPGFDLYERGVYDTLNMDINHVASFTKGHMYFCTKSHNSSISNHSTAKHIVKPTKILVVYKDKVQITTREQLGRVLGCGTNHISSWISGKRSIPTKYGILRIERL